MKSLKDKGVFGETVRTRRGEGEREVQGEGNDT